MKKYIIIVTVTLFILITSILIFKQRKKEIINIEPINNEINTEIKEEVKKQIQEIEKCEKIDNPLLTPKSENNHPIFDSNGPITEEKLKSIIDNQLSFLVYKNNYQEITNNDIFYRALIAGEKYEEPSFTKDELEDALEKTVLSNLSIKHESHYSKRGYNYIYNDKIYTTDDSNLKHIDAYDEKPIYGEAQEYKEANGIHKISIKYLWIAGDYEPSTTLYRDRYDARKKINKIQMPNNVKCYSKWIKDHFKKYEKDLPTYTYAFKEVNNHIYLVDFYITENNEN